MKKPSWDEKSVKSRAVWPPEPGFFAMRMVKNGWRVPARILCTSDGWQAEINGELQPAHDDPAHAINVAWIWHWANEIPESEYRWLEAVREAAKTADPEHPALHPRQAIDPMRLKPLQPRTPR